MPESEKEAFKKLLRDYMDKSDIGDLIVEIQRIETVRGRVDDEDAEKFIDLIADAVFG